MDIWEMKLQVLYFVARHHPEADRPEVIIEAAKKYEAFITSNAESIAIKPFSITGDEA